MDMDICAELRGLSTSSRPSVVVMTHFTGGFGPRRYQCMTGRRWIFQAELVVRCSPWDISAASCLTVSLKRVVLGAVGAHIGTAPHNSDM